MGDGIVLHGIHDTLCGVESKASNPGSKHTGQHQRHSKYREADLLNRNKKRGERYLRQQTERVRRTNMRPMCIQTSTKGPLVLSDVHVGAGDGTRCSMEALCALGIVASHNACCSFKLRRRRWACSISSCCMLLSND